MFDCGDSVLRYVVYVTVWWQCHEVCCMCDCGDSVMRYGACLCGDSVMRYVVCVTVVTVSWGMLYMWLCGDSVMRYVACVTVVTMSWGMLYMWLCGDSVMRYVACVTVVTVSWGMLYMWLCGDSVMRYVVYVTVWWQCHEVCCMCDCGDSVMRYVVYVTVWWQCHEVCCMCDCGDSVMRYVVYVTVWWQCHEVCCMCDCVVTVSWGMLYMWLCGDSVMRYVVYVIVWWQCHEVCCVYDCMLWLCDGWMLNSMQCALCDCVFSYGSVTVHVEDRESAGLILNEVKVRPSDTILDLKRTVSFHFFYTRLPFLLYPLFCWLFPLSGSYFPWKEALECFTWAFLCQETCLRDQRNFGASPKSFSSLKRQDCSCTVLFFSCNIIINIELYLTDHWAAQYWGGGGGQHYN